MQKKMPQSSKILVQKTFLVRNDVSKKKCFLKKSCGWVGGL